MPARKTFHIDAYDDSQKAALQNRSFGWTLVPPPFHILLGRSDGQELWKSFVQATWDQFYVILFERGYHELSTVRDALQRQVESLAADREAYLKELAEAEFNLRNYRLGEEAIAREQLDESFDLNSKEAQELLSHEEAAGVTLVWTLSRDDLESEVKGLRATFWELESAQDFGIFRLAVLQNVERRFLFYGEVRKWADLKSSEIDLMAEAGTWDVVITRIGHILRSYDEAVARGKVPKIGDLWEAGRAASPEVTEDAIEKDVRRLLSNLKRTYPERDVPGLIALLRDVFARFSDK